MALLAKKRKLVEDKEKYIPEKFTIQPHDIMPIINHAWEQSFARVTPNKKAISDRGWFPYNFNLMTYLIIFTTITKEE